MANAYDLNAATITNAGAVVTAAVPVAGDTLTVRNFDAPARASLCTLIRNGTTAGIVGIKSPYMHDEVKGYRTRALAANADDLFPDTVNQTLNKNDTLIIEGTGGATEVESVVMGIYYENPTWAGGRFAAPGDIMARIKNVLTMEVAVTTSATVGLWGSALLTSGGSLLHANADYAVLGYEVDVQVSAIALQGIDTSNLKCGGPGITDRFKTRNYFIRDSDYSGLPMIPIINAQNATATNVLACAGTASVAVNIDLILAELS
jgi:hypothetical protein